MASAKLVVCIKSSTRSSGSSSRSKSSPLQVVGARGRLGVEERGIRDSLRCVVA